MIWSICSCPRFLAGFLMGKGVFLMALGRNDQCEGPRGADFIIRRQLKPEQGRWIFVSRQSIAGQFLQTFEAVQRAIRRYQLRQSEKK